MMLPAKNIFSCFFICLLFVAAYTTAQTPTTQQEVKTDVMARKVISLLNARHPDSVYNLTGLAFQLQLPAANWQQAFQKQFINLLPLKNLTFISSYNGISSYKVQSVIMLTFSIGLDVLDKIENFSFVPYQPEAKSIAMTDAEKKTDVVAMQVLYCLNAHQADKMCTYAGQGYFNKYLDSATFKNIVEKQLYHLTPLSKPVFVGSTNGVNKYKIGGLQYLIGLDNTGKFDTWAIQPYIEEAKKVEKAATDNPMHSKLDSLMDKYLSNYIQTKGNAGISAAVYYKGADHYYNYGETVIDSHKLPNAHTLYEIGSITKTFTATLLAKAVLSGLVTLDDPITKFLPDSVASNPDLKLITLKQLSNHTSGLPRMPDNINPTVTDLNQPYEHYTEAFMFAFLKKFTTIRAPGATYEYSNLAVGLLGVILERIYHKPYEELLKLYITQPLQLNETKIRLTSLDVKHLAQGYDAAGNAVAPWRQQSTKAAGAIKSCTVDMLQYGKLQLAQFSNPLSKALKLTHQPTLNDGVNKVGLGWHYLDKDADPVIQHNGGTGGCRTAICVNLDKGIVLVVLTNNATTGDSFGLNLMPVVEQTLLK